MFEEQKVAPSSEIIDSASGAGYTEKWALTQLDKRDNHIKELERKLEEEPIQIANYLCKKSKGKVSLTSVASKLVELNESIASLFDGNPVVQTLLQPLCEAAKDCQLRLWSRALEKEKKRYLLVGEKTWGAEEV